MLAPSIMLSSLIRYITKTVTKFIITYSFMLLWFNVLVLIFTSAQWKQWVWFVIFIALLPAIVFLKHLFT
jgi:hypothetical protein